MIGLIWAQARDAAGRAVIGADGGIPWHVPEDFAHFQRTTAGHPVVMGRRTWESLPDRVRPLPRRTNVVVTRGPADGVRALAVPERHDSLRVADSIAAALAVAAEASGGDEVWVMGGSRVYADALPAADRLVVTEIDLEVDGDVYAPEVDPEEWSLLPDGTFAGDVDTGGTDADGTFAGDVDTGGTDAGEAGWATSSGADGLRYRIRTYRRARPPR
ncbi:dihydrofolate reductase [Isoptericola aurantiacus]|uniref:dihydrofolate reductase n=1 Tax=Isoptericola aurantiacus TaxID=3377839 RepID=UPI00383A19A6